jgi:hypothetical protein
MTDLIKKWSATGLIPNDVDYFRQKFIATNLDNAANYLKVLANSTTDIEEIAGEILPLVCRISKETHRDIDIEKFIDSFIEVFDLLKVAIKKIRPNVGELESNLLKQDYYELWAKYSI